MYDLSIKNGLIITANGKIKADIYVKDGVIACIVNGEQYEAVKTIDAKRKYVFPGFVDPHSHLNDPGGTIAGDFYTGTCSAAAGGITTLMEHPLTFPLPSTFENLNDKRKIGETKAVIDFCLFGACATDNEKEYIKMIDMGAIAFKAFITYSPEIPQIDDANMLKTMEHLASKNVVMSIHCENDSIVRAGRTKQEKLGNILPIHYESSRAEISELEAINRMSLFAYETGVKLHVVHCSVSSGVEVVNAYKKKGADITVETCTHYLSLDETDVEKWGVYAICNPPIRKRETVEKLWKVLLEGKIDFIGSDHVTYTFEQKETGAKNVFDTPAGFRGIQTCFPIFFDEAVNKRGMKLERFVEMSSLAAAKRYGVFPRKGQIAIGSDADIVIFDPKKKWTVKKEDLFYKMKWTPYLEREVTGYVEKTIVRGNVVYENGQIIALAGYGNFIPTEAVRNRS